MNREQFCFWLQGILDSNKELNNETVDLIKSRLSNIKENSLAISSLPITGSWNPTPIAKY